MNKPFLTRFSVVVAGLAGALILTGQAHAATAPAPASLPDAATTAPVLTLQAAPDLMVAAPLPVLDSRALDGVQLDAPAAPTAVAVTPTPVRVARVAAARPMAVSMAAPAVAAVPVQADAPRVADQAAPGVSVVQTAQTTPRPGFFQRIWQAVKRVFAPAPLDSATLLARAAPADLAQTIQTPRATAPITAAPKVIQRQSAPTLPTPQVAAAPAESRPFAPAPLIAAVTDGHKAAKPAKTIKPKPTILDEVPFDQQDTARVAEASCDAQQLASKACYRAVAAASQWARYIGSAEAGADFAENHCVKISWWDMTADTRCRLAADAAIASLLPPTRPVAQSVRQDAEGAIIIGAPTR